jgi:Lon protease-like protein
VELPIFPLNTVLFPGGRLPLHIFEERYKLMINMCIDEHRPFGVCLIREGREAGGAAQPFEVGTSAHIGEVQRLDEGRLNLICTGGERFRILEVTDRTPYLIADVTLLETEPPVDPATPQLAGEAATLFARYVRLNLATTNQWARTIEMPSEPDLLADYIGGRLGVDAITKQRLLETLSPALRLGAEVEILTEAVRQLEGRVEVARAARWLGFGVMN